MNTAHFNNHIWTLNSNRKGVNNIHVPRRKQQNKEQLYSLHPPFSSVLSGCFLTCYWRPLQICSFSFWVKRFLCNIKILHFKTYNSNKSNSSFQSKLKIHLISSEYSFVISTNPSSAMHAFVVSVCWVREWVSEWVCVRLWLRACVRVCVRVCVCVCDEMGISIGLCMCSGLLWNGYHKQYIIIIK